MPNKTEKMNLKEELHNYFENKVDIVEEDIISIVEKHQLQQYLVRYRKVIEAPHALLDDEIMTISKVVEVTNVVEINDMFDNIVDIKRI